MLAVTARGASALITGDIEARGENATLRAGALASDVVVVPHHGSATSSSQAFVDAVRPKLALVSAGYANRWGFPKPAVRARWERGGARVAVTGDDGALTVSLDERGAALVTERSRRVRYWQAQAGGAADGEETCRRPVGRLRERALRRGLARVRRQKRAVALVPSFRWSNSPLETSVRAL